MKSFLIYDQIDYQAFIFCILHMIHFRPMIQRADQFSGSFLVHNAFLVIWLFFEYFRYFVPLNLTILSKRARLCIPKIIHRDLTHPLPWTFSDLSKQAFLRQRKICSSCLFQVPLCAHREEKKRILFVFVFSDSPTSSPHHEYHLYNQKTLISWQPCSFASTWIACPAWYCGVRRQTSTWDWHRLRAASF